MNYIQHYEMTACLMTVYTEVSWMKLCGLMMLLSVEGSTGKRRN